MSVLVLLLSLCGMFANSAGAQDRSVPRFGPLVGPDTVDTGPFDYGRLWSVAQAPLDYFSEEYGVAADERGLRHARRSTVRLPRCSGALVSARGLVLTAGSCVRRALSEEDGVAFSNGAYSVSERSDESSVADLYAERVIEVDVVTDEVEAASRTGAEGAGERRPWREAMEVVQRDRQQEVDPDHHVDVVRESGGQRYVAYTYRRYEDVRLVFLPERPVSAVPGAHSHLSYPQYTWDVAVLRIYEGDTPLRSPDHFEVPRDGMHQGDGVFGLGYPRTTNRTESHHQLGVRRDLTLPAERDLLSTWVDHLNTYVDTASANGGRWQTELETDREILKKIGARFESLRDEYFFARLRKRDEGFQQAVTTDSGDVQTDLLDQLEALQSEKYAVEASYRAFSFLEFPTYSSPTLSRAFRALGEQDGGSSRDSLDRTMPVALEAALIESHLDRLQTHLDLDSTQQEILHTLETEGGAAIVQESVFGDGATGEGQTSEPIPEDDLARQLVRAVADEYTSFRTRWAELNREERQLVEALSHARHDMIEHPVTLPSKRALRVTDGRVRGYPYNGTKAPIFTTFYGLYGEEASFRSEETGGLPERWSAATSRVQQSTPLTAVASVDPGGGMRGAPLVNSALQLVGIVFDGNVQSAGAQYLFLPERMRVVALDIRGLLEGLDSVYGSEVLVEEIQGDTSSQ